MWTDRGGKTEEIVKTFGPELRNDFVATSGILIFKLPFPTHSAMNRSSRSTGLINCLDFLL